MEDAIKRNKLYTADKKKEISDMQEQFGELKEEIEINLQVNAERKQDLNEVNI